METVPTPQPDEEQAAQAAFWAGHPIIDQAEAQLRAYAEHVSHQPMTRADAERLLPYWSHYREMSPRERAAVLVRFGPQVVESHEAYTGGWISGAMASEKAPRVETPELIAARWRADGRTFRPREVAFEFAEQIRRLRRWQEDQVIAASELPDATELTREVAESIREERESRARWGDDE
jgi:glycine/D-amino acid oxidase-like deaminating enzyme